MPLVLGPSRRMPEARAMARSSAWRWRPSGVPASAKPPAPTTAALTPFSAQARTASTVWAAGTTVMAQSAGSGRSATDRRHGTPSTSPPAGLTGYMAPANPPALRLRTTAGPILPGVGAAPVAAPRLGWDRNLRSDPSANAVRSRLFDAERFAPQLH